MAAKQSSQHIVASSTVMLCNQCSVTVFAIKNTRPGQHVGLQSRLFQFAHRPLTWRGAHHTSRGSFSAAVLRRCYICYMLDQACPKQSRHYSDLFQIFYEIRATEQDRFLLQFVIELHHEDLSIKPNSQVIEHYGMFKILPKSDVPNLRSPLTLPANTETNDCFVQVHDWLESCTKSHSVCCQDRRTSHEYTIRLLNVDQDLGSNVRLETFEKGRTHPKYVTMSHCWSHGSTTDEIILKTDNIGQLHTSIGVDDLPRKFRDAIKIARSLRVVYLWIDALCIIQDSRTDWEEQSAVMGNIYAGSYCNIAATNADRNKGCFRDRPVEVVEPYRIAYPKDNSDGYTHVIGYDDFWCNSLLDTDLHTRAWVLQERLLSPRTVHFGQEQMFWECRDSKACEAYPSGIPAVFSNDRTATWRQEERQIRFKQAPVSETWSIEGIRKYLLNLLRIEHAGQSVTDPLSQDANAFWNEIVERYMQCNLTRSSDKLIAIAGIANLVREATGERYLAGLWDNADLPLNLLWYVPVRRRADGLPSRRHPPLHALDYVAPSWSWASIDAEIKWSGPAKCDRILVKLKRSHTVTEDDSVGAIRITKMTLHGRLHRARLRILHMSEDGSPKEDGSYMLSPRGLTDNPDDDAMDPEADPTSNPLVFLDTPLLPLRKMNVYLLPICTKWKRGSSRAVSEVAGLILRQHSVLSEKAFERVGVFGFDDMQAYNEVTSRVTGDDQEQTIALV